MHLISSLLFAMSANIDTFIVGISCGIKRDHISFVKNVVISLITLTGTVFSISAGLTFVSLLPSNAAQITGSIILILLGLYYIIKFIIKQKKNQTQTSVSSSPVTPEDSTGEDDSALQITALSPNKTTLPLKDTIILGLALSINNIGMGIGASITGIELVPTAILTAVFSMLFLALGNHLGESTFFQTVLHFADPLSGFILIGLGIYELFI